MEKLSFQVAEYDAPLDLILHLVSKHKLDIVEIDISALLEQYLEIIQQWQEQDLEVASEFLEMASRLVYMKTVSLLPRHKEEMERLRQDLTGELMEYQLCKVAAGLLGESNLYSDIFVRPAESIDVDLTYRHTHSASILFEAMADALGRGARKLPPPKETFDPIVTRPVVSVSSKIFGILRQLREEQQLPLDRILEHAENRSSLVANFLALLELIKAGSIEITPEQFVILCFRKRDHA